MVEVRYPRAALSLVERDETPPPILKSPLLKASKRRVDIYMAGPGMMYIPLPELEPPARVILIYDLFPLEKAGYLLSVASLVALVIIVWRRPTLIYPLEEG